MRQISNNQFLKHVLAVVKLSDLHVTFNITFLGYFFDSVRDELLRSFQQNILGNKNCARLWW